MSKVACPGCGAEHSSTALACPNCHRLIHGDRLKTLGARAQAARQKGDIASEREAWRGAVELLPKETRQRLTIEKRLLELDAPAEIEKPASPPSSWTGKGGVLGALALAAWKLKGVLLLGLGKLKFLALGLSKMSTLLSFLASFGVYWSLWGWRYALGFLVAMYIHEMGHVAALRRFGIPASAPMFVPGFGAFVRMNQHPKSVGDDARIGLAGPEWGLAAAGGAYGAYFATGAPIWAAIGHSAAFLNLFNLLPIWQLDGGRAFEALTRAHRFVVAAALAAAWVMTHEGLLGLICVVAFGRAIYGQMPVRPDAGALGRFVFLVAAFSVILAVGSPSIR